jgi:hypothetical protein
MGALEHSLRVRFVTNEPPRARPNGRTFNKGDTKQRTPYGLYETGRTPCGDESGRMTPFRSPFGARMQWPEPAHTEQSLAR